MRHEATHPALAPMLCFDLYSASRALTAVYRRLLAEHGLTYPQYLVLVVLWHDGQDTVRQLSDAVQLDYGTLTPLLRRMELADLVTRRQDGQDHRVMHIGLTARGDRLRRIEPGVHAAVVAATGLDHDQIVGVQQSLRALADSAGRVASAGQATPPAADTPHAGNA